jgi:hypothetical protein
VDVLPTYRALVYKNIAKRLVWKDKRHTRPCRLQIPNVPTQVKEHLFPGMNSSLQLETKEEVQNVLQQFGNLSRDFFAHSQELCTQPLCILHCDRVSVTPPVSISYDNQVLTIAFWIQRYVPSGSIY